MDRNRFALAQRRAYFSWLECPECALKTALAYYLVSISNLVGHSDWSLKRRYGD